MQPVQRILFSLLVLFPLLAGATEWTVKTIPDPKSSPSRTSISDPDDNISPSMESSINEITWDIEQRANVQFGIVIVNSIGSEVPKLFASDLFNYWGIGKSGKDNGLLLLIVLDQKRWEFESGYGIEGDLPDYTLSEMGTAHLVPYFKQQDFQGGILAVTAALRTKLFKTYNIPFSEDSLTVPEQPYTTTTDFNENYDRAEEQFMFKAGMLNQLVWFMIIYLVVMGSWFYFAFVWNSPGSPRNKYGAKRGSVVLFFIVAVLPVASVFIWYNNEAMWNRKWFNIMALGSAYLTIMFLITGYRTRINRAIVNRNRKDVYRAYSDLRSSNSLWTFIGPILFPLTFVPYLFWYYGKCRQLRRADRECKKCAANMTFSENVVEELADDKYLNKGQLKEEYLKSRDWDVWLCRSCNTAEVMGYKAFYTSYGECPACKSIAELSEGSMTITPATYSSSGKGKTMYRCKSCGNYRETYYTIPMKTRSSSSGGGGGGGFGGGSSWGGGRSGGGGAGGGW